MTPIGNASWDSLGGPALLSRIETRLVVMEEREALKETLRSDQGAVEPDQREVWGVTQACRTPANRASPQNHHSRAGQWALSEADPSIDLSIFASQIEASTPNPELEKYSNEEQEDAVSILCAF